LKFLSQEPEKLTNKDLGIVLTASVPTNKTRFILYDMVQKETMAARLELSEFILLNCIEKLTIKNKEVSTDDMINADLSDSTTADIYFGCVDMVVSHILVTDTDDTKK